MSVYQEHKPGSGDGDYLKLKDGDKVKLRIVSEPAVSVYKAGDRPRYNWVVWNRELKKPQVYSSGVSVYRQIADLTEDWGDPTTFDITIKRTGSGLNDTEYSVVPVKTSPDLTKEELEVASKIDLIAACKGKMLAEYIEDNKLPAPVTVSEEEPVPSGGDAPGEDAPDFDLNDLPE